MKPFNQKHLDVVNSLIACYEGTEKFSQKCLLCELAVEDCAKDRPTQMPHPCTYCLWLRLEETACGPAFAQILSQKEYHLLWKGTDTPSLWEAFKINFKSMSESTAKRLEGLRRWKTELEILIKECEGTSEHI